MRREPSLINQPLLRTLSAAPAQSILYLQEVLQEAIRGEISILSEEALAKAIYNQISSQGRSDSDGCGKVFGP